MKKSIYWALICIMFAVGFVACGGGGGGNSASSSTYSISGTVTNSTSQSGPMFLGACSDLTMTNCTYGISLGSGNVVSYTLPNVPPGTYYVGACVSVDGIDGCNVPPDLGITYASNPVTVSNANVTSINMTIH